MQPAKRLQYEPDPNKFDLRTHLWDGQGNLVKKNLYTLYVIEGRQYFERPIQSGNLWFENNQPAGRVLFEKDSSGKMQRRIDEGAEHIAFIPKLEGDDALYYALEQEKLRTADLERELAAVRADRAPKVEVKTESKVIESELKTAMPSLRKDKA